ncbi:MAG: HicB like antitoxin of bacterial toxin-antitoxin system [Firmicutes bacterium]|nr:HicB like antitoxin of bacterial toxin-antitoxin system [Bacillota bacterium]
MHINETYVYPAIFEKTDTGYSVMFPDLPGCFTVGVNLHDAYEKAREAMGLHLWGFERDGDPFPKASSIDTLQEVYVGALFGLVEVALQEYREKLETRSVKKTLTIPYYLNKLAEKRKINFSRTLQAALKRELNL